MVGPAADGDGVFFEQAQGGCRLASIEDRRRRQMQFAAASGHDVDELARERGDARKTLKEIERSPFAGEDGARRTSEPANLGCISNGSAFENECGDSQLAVEFGKHCLDYVQAGDDTRLFGDNNGVS